MSLLPSYIEGQAIALQDRMINGHGRECSLIFNLEATVCPNCIINPRTMESTNVYKTGGPEPFVAGQICPVCFGAGRIPESEGRLVIKMLINWDDKTWSKVLSTGNTLRIASDVVKTKGFIADLSKVRLADGCILDIQNSEKVFRLAGDPYLPYNVIQDRYFVATWENRI